MPTTPAIHPLDLRQALGLTQPQMADRLHIAERTVARCEAQGLPTKNNRTRRAYLAAIDALRPLAAPLLDTTPDRLAAALDALDHDQLLDDLAHDAHTVRRLLHPTPLPDAGQDLTWARLVAQAATYPAA